MSEEVDDLFLAAREIIDPAERSAFLERSCLNAPELRGSVEQMLADEERAEAFFAETGAENRAGIGPLKEPSSQDQATEKMGQTLGRYTLKEKLGEGGCGVVYVADQTEPVRRQVALKVLKLGMDTRQVVARFEAERQALAMMNHQNIAKVFDGGATEAGRPYFVMELVRGVKITDYCDQNSLSTQERLRLFIEICQAVQHAHQKGIIHRDIKPSNILVTTLDGAPVPKIIDFGIAKATEGRLTDATVHTQLHQFMGTPAYMSPEQMELGGMDIDTRSDIYSLGVLLYELLTGKTPFDTKELLAQGIDALRRTIREKDPLRPSTKLGTLKQDEITTTAERRSADRVRLLHQIKGDLDWIVMKCLEKDRARRYETANGLAMDLQRHLSCEPVCARPPSKLYEFQKTVWRHKFGFGATTAVILALTIGLLISVWQSTLAREAAAAAVEAKREATARAAAELEAREESEAVTKFLIKVFQSPDPARDGRTITVAEILDKAAEDLDRGMIAQPAVRAKLQTTIGVTYQTLGLYYKAAPLLEQARDYHLSVSGPENGSSLYVLSSLASSYAKTGRSQEALVMREDLLRAYQKVTGPGSLSTIRAMHNLANSYSASGRRQESLKLRQEVLELFEKLVGTEHKSTARAMYSLASSYKSDGHLAEALELCEKSVEAFRNVFGPEHPSTLRAMSALASYYGAAGRHKEALALQEEAVPLFAKTLGPDHLETESAERKLADFRAKLDRLTAEVLSADTNVELMVLGDTPWSNLLGREVLVSSALTRCQTGVILTENDEYRLYPCPTDTWNTSPERWSNVDYRGHIREHEKTESGRPYMQLCYMIGGTNLSPVQMGASIKGVGELVLVPSDIEGGGKPANNKGAIRVKILKVNRE